MIEELTGTMTLVSREKPYRNLPTTRYGMPSIHSERTIKPADVIVRVLQKLPIQPPPISPLVQTLLLRLGLRLTRSRPAATLLTRW